MTNKDVKEIISNTLNITESVESDATDMISESYVVQDKTFNLATETISKKSKQVHMELYQHYVDCLNKVSAKLDTASRKESDSSLSEYRSLKQDEMYNLNAVYLHELYFANVADAYSEITMDSLTFMRLERDFGTFAEWQKDFIACAMAAREGWVVTAYSTALKRFINFFVDLHDKNVPVGCYPIITLDVWSHAFFHDKLGEKRAYVIEMMKELNWDVIEERVKRADLIAEALK